MTPSQLYLLLEAYAGVLGLCFGSFMNVCVARMPEDRSVVAPASACPCCGTPIRAYDNVPVLAWFWLRGRCRACKEPISPLYPTVEALFGVLAVLLFREVIPEVSRIDLAHAVALGWYGYLLFALVALTFIDLKHSIIPDPFSIYGVPVGVGGAALLGWLGYGGAISWQQSVVGAVSGSGVLLLLMGAYWLVRRAEGMGMGDVKLLALIGSYYGAFPGVIGVLILAGISGSVIGVLYALATGRHPLKSAIPFGPFLALGTLVWMFWGQEAGHFLSVRFGLFQLMTSEIPLDPM